MTTLRPRRPAVLSLAALAGLSLALSGCGVDEGDAQAALESAEDRLAQAEDRISELEADSSNRVDLGELQRQAEGALDGADQRVGELLEDLRGRAEPLREITEQDLRDLELPRIEGLDLDAEAAVEDLMKSLPSGPDMADVEALREDGRVIVEYAESALEADPQVLEDTMREVAEQARRALPDLKDVEFRVGGQSFTF